MAYIDDVPAISHQTGVVVEEIKTQFKFKNDKVEEPSSYLGAKLEWKSLNGQSMWTVTSVKYVRVTIENVQRAIKNTQWKIPSKSRSTTPMQSNIIPELDGAPN